MLLDLLELLHEILDSGLSWATGLSIFLAWHKYKEGKEKKAAHDRMERKIDLIMDKEGIAWSGPQNGSQKAPQSFREWLQWSSGVISPAASKLRRRVKKMTINKTWLVMVITYIFGVAASKWGIEFGNQAADLAADFILQFVLPPLMAWLNKTKPAPAVVEEEEPLPQDLDPDKFIQG